MKLAFLLDSFGMGGSEKTALILLELLKKYANIDITLIIIAKKDSRISKNYYNTPKNIKTIYIYDDNYTPIKKLLLTPWTVYKILKILKKEKITHLFSLHDYSNLINALSKIIIKHKVITSERRYSKHYFGSKNKYMKYFLKFVFNRSDVIIVNDIDIKKSLIKDYNIYKPIKILNNLLIPKQYNINNLEKNSEYITFITIGRLSDEKNTKDILYAFSKVKINNKKLIIIGDGPNRKFLENLAKKLNIDKNIEFKGQVNNVYKYLLKSDIFVFSSLNEGFPNVILEAMYAKLPIISYNFKAGINSILDGGKYGVLVEKGNVGMLSKEMEEMAKDANKRNKYSLLSVERIKNYTDEKRYLNSFLSIIRNV